MPKRLYQHNRYKRRKNMLNLLVKKKLTDAYLDILADCDEHIASCNASIEQAHATIKEAHIELQQIDVQRADHRHKMEQLSTAADTTYIALQEARTYANIAISGPLAQSVATQLAEREAQSELAHKKYITFQKDYEQAEQKNSFRTFEIK